MDSYIIFAIISAILGGLYNFRAKIIVERNYNTHVVNIYDYIVSWIIALFALFITHDISDLSHSEVYIIIGLACINSLFAFSSIFSRVEALKNIDSVIFFPLYKTFGPIIVTCISLFFFQESLTFKETLGIITAIAVPLMLITKTEDHIQTNLLRGVFFVLATSVLTSISTSSMKLIRVQDLSIEMFVFFGLTLGSILSLGSYRFQKNKSKKKYNSAGVIKLGIVAGFLHFGTFYAFANAMHGNFAIVFSINSFSILVPIILSIILYKEHFNLKKAIVIVLSIISILLFI